MAAEKRLVVLYGPPASGKLPIAEIISAQTDWILFDNSAAIDFVAQFLQPGTPRFLELIDSLRLDLVRAMLAEGRSVVFTFVYFGFNREDISFFKFLAAAATSVGASLHLVQLRCSEETLLKRVSNSSWISLGNRLRRRRMRRFQKTASSINRCRVSIVCRSIQTAAARGQRGLNDRRVRAKRGNRSESVVRGPGWSELRCFYAVSEGLCT